MRAREARRLKAIGTPVGVFGQTVTRGGSGVAGMRPRAHDSTCCMHSGSLLLGDYNEEVLVELVTPIGWDRKLRHPRTVYRRETKTQ